jgi:tetratricopeptide (TPR) repeat protein
VTRATEERNTQYLLSGTNQRGKRVVVRLYAPSLESAREEMVARGYAEITIHTDDGRRAVVFREQPQEDKALLPPGDEVRLHHASGFERRIIRAKVFYRALWVPLLLGVGTLVLQLMRGTFPNLVSWLIALGLAAPLLLALCTRNRLDLMHEADEARYQADWEAMLRVVDRLRVGRSTDDSAGMALGVGSRHAIALAGLHRLDEAVAVLKHLEQQGVAEYTVQAYLGIVYGMAQEFEQARASLERATEIDPENWMGWVGLSEVLCIGLSRPHEARRALAMVRAERLSEDSLWAVRAAEASITLCEGKYQDARERLEAACSNAERRARTTPIAKALRDKLGALLAIACIKTGQVERARELFAGSEPFLRRHECKQLLARCASAGLTGSPLRR